MLNRISDIEEETIDWQWFATDKLGHIASFTTGACLRLPGRTKDHRIAVEVLDEYFRQRAAATGYAVLQEKTAMDLLSGVEMGFAALEIMPGDGSRDPRLVIYASPEFPCALELVTDSDRCEQLLSELQVVSPGR